MKIKFFYAEEALNHPMDYGICVFQNFVTIFYCASISLANYLLIRTLPAGYMELGESAIEGAIRETWEEAKAEVEVEAPFAQLDIPRIGQVYNSSVLQQAGCYI